MKKVINPGRARKSINFIDNIVYSRQKDLEGNEMELKMSIMLQNGNSEMRLASGHDDEGDDKTPKPAILWVPGGGYRGCDKNLMVAERPFLQMQDMLLHPCTTAAVQRRICRLKSLM